jgi:hypothetical protein
MIRFRSILSIAAGFGLSLSPILAQPQIPHRFELTPQVQYRFGGTLAADQNALFDVDLEVDESTALGITFDIPLSRALQLELLASRQKTDLRFDEGLFGDNLRVADFELTYLHAGLLVQGGNRTVNPFFVFSGGLTRLSPDLPNTDAETRFSFSLGGGVKVFFTPNLGLRFEGRGFWTALDEDGSDRDCRFRCDWDDPAKRDLEQGMASLGLIFSW